jgi:hypothetical protein
VIFPKDKNVPSDKASYIRIERSMTVPNDESMVDEMDWDGMGWTGME